MLLKDYFKEKRLPYGREIVQPRETGEFGTIDEEYMFIFMETIPYNTLLIKHGKIGVYEHNFKGNDIDRGLSKDQVKVFFKDLSNVRLKYNDQSLEDYFNVTMPLGSVVKINRTKYLLTKRSGNMATLFAVDLDTGMVTRWINTNDKIGITKNTLEELFPKYNPLEDEWIGPIKEVIKNDW